MSFCSSTARGAGFPPTAATAPTLTTLFMIR